MGIFIYNFYLHSMKICFFLCDESKYSRNWGQSEAVLPSIHMITLIDFLFYIFLLFSHFHLEIKISAAFGLNRNFKFEN